MPLGEAGGNPFRWMVALSEDSSHIDWWRACTTLKNFDSSDTWKRQVHPMASHRTYRTLMNIIEPYRTIELHMLWTHLFRCKCKNVPRALQTVFIPVCFRVSDVWCRIMLLKSHSAACETLRAHSQRDLQPKVENYSERKCKNFLKCCTPFPWCLALGPCLGCLWRSPASSKCAHIVSGILVFVSMTQLREKEMTYFFGFVRLRLRPCKTSRHLRNDLCIVPLHQVPLRISGFKVQ